MFYRIENYEQNNSQLNRNNIKLNNNEFNNINFPNFDNLKNKKFFKRIKSINIISKTENIKGPKSKSVK